MISGQSFRRSRFSSRRLVRKRETYEGPEVDCIVVVGAGGFKVPGAGTRRLRVRAREVLLVEADIVD